MLSYPPSFFEDGGFMYNRVVTRQRRGVHRSIYADFEFYLSPTFDFKQELLAQGKDVEVLKPASLREDMKQMVMEMLERYKDS